MACAALPSFLRECYKFPPHHHYIEQRAFEVVVSLEILLKTINAAELLVELLLDHPNYDPDEDKDTPTTQRVIWLSDDVFIANGYGFGVIFYKFSITLDGDHNVDVNICKVPSAADHVETETHEESLSAPSLGPERGVMDAWLHLLAKHNTITSIEVHQHIDHERVLISAGPLFPASLDALKTFASETQSPRELCLDEAGLSKEQWRAVAFNCNKNVQLSYRMHDDFYEGMQALIEAMESNQCPAQLYFWDIDEMPTDVFQEFVSAMESARSSLNSLELKGFHWESSKLIPLCRAIATNHGLQRLGVVHISGRWSGGGLALSDTEWDLVSSALASHPSLRTLKFDVGFAKSSVSPERDQIMIQYISKNKILCKFTTSDRTFHDSEHVKQAVRPFLEFNRFRPVVKAIKLETDSTRRKKLFTWALLCDPVSKRLSFRFLLLKEHTDLLAELSWPDNVLLSRWNHLMARVLAVEQEMQNRDMLLPSLELLLGGKKRRR